NPSVFFPLSFSVHPFTNVERAINKFDPLSDTGIQKPNCIDIHQIQFVQVQNHLCRATLDLSAQIVQLLISKFTAKPDSSAASDRKPLHPQRHLRTSIHA